MTELFKVKDEMKISADHHDHIDNKLSENVWENGAEMSLLFKFEPAHEIMILFVLRKLILETRIRRHPVGLKV